MSSGVGKKNSWLKTIVLDWKGMTAPYWLEKGVRSRSQEVEKTGKLLQLSKGPNALSLPSSRWASVDACLSRTLNGSSEVPAAPRLLRKGTAAG